MNIKSMLPVILVGFTLAACAGLSDAVSNETPASGNEAPGSPLDPLPKDDKMVRGDVTVSSSELLIMESYPLQIDLAVEGTLPTPCHQLRASVRGPDHENIIKVELYSLVDPNLICAQVIQAFEEKIPLGSYPDGSYTVYLNDEWVGEFTQ